jgi:hypothetical protein
LAPIAVGGMLNIPFAKVMQQYQSKFMQAQDAKHHEGCEAAIVGEI